MQKNDFKVFCRLSIFFFVLFYPRYILISGIFFEKIRKLFFFLFLNYWPLPLLVSQRVTVLHCNYFIRFYKVGLINKCWKRDTLDVWLNKLISIVRCYVTSYYLVFRTQTTLFEYKYTVITLTQRKNFSRTRNVALLLTGLVSWLYDWV